jgi:hypothetical protein
VANIRVTRFPLNTRYSILVPNEHPFEQRLIKRIVRSTKRQQGQQGQPVQLPLPFQS